MTNGNDVLLAVGGHSSTVLVRDGSTGNIVKELPFPEGNVVRIAFSGQRSVAKTEPLYLAAGGSLGRVRVFDVSQDSSNVNKFVPYTGHHGAVTAVGFEPKHTSFLYSASEDGTLQTWRPAVTNATVKDYLPGGVLSIVEPKLSSGDVVQGTQGRKEKDRSGKLGCFQGPFTRTKFENWGPNCLVAIHDATYHPTRDLFFTVDAIGRLGIWDHAARKLRSDFVPHRSRRSIKCMELSPDLHWLVLANFDGLIFVYDVERMLSNPRAKPLSFRGSSSYITQVRMSVSSNLLVCTTRQDGIKVFRMCDVMAYGLPERSVDIFVDDTVTAHREYASQVGWIWDAAFLGREDNHLFTCSSEKDIVLWNLNDPRLTCAFRNLEWPAVTMALREVVPGGLKASA